MSKPILGKIQKPTIQKTVVGRAILTPHTRQPIVPTVGTGYGANFQPQVVANTKINPLQRMPPGR
jgi:hypothetical protein